MYESDAIVGYLASTYGDGKIPIPLRMGPLTIEGELVAKSTGTVSDFSIGDRVFHLKFGNGNVTAVDGNKLTIRFDKAGDQHYDYASAWIKATRGSDPDASLYYLAVMLEGGEDARFLVRRMVILASEDIGNADPQALVIATAAAAAVEHVGLPECIHALSQATIYLALAPKSKAATKSIGAAMHHVRQFGAAAPPPQIRSHPVDYDSPHDHPGHLGRPLLGVPFAERTLVNVNFPAIEPDAVQGIRVVRQGFHDYARGSVVEGTDPRGRPYFWNSSVFTLGDTQDDTDVDVIDPSVDIVKSGEDVAREGDEVTYTFVVTNEGAVPHEFVIERVTASSPIVSKPK